MARHVGPNAGAAIDNSNAKAPAGANAGFVIGFQNAEPVAKN